MVTLSKTIGCTKVLRTPGRLLAAAVLAFGLSSSLASAQTLDLEIVAPSRAPANTPGRTITLSGDFDIGSNTATLGVFWSRSNNPLAEDFAATGEIINPGSQGSRDVVQAQTPSVPAGDYFVFVQIEPGTTPIRSDALPFTFVAPPSSRIIAQILLDNFEAADANNDGVISLEEARAFLQGQGILLTDAQFNELEGATTGGGLTEEELEVIIDTRLSCIEALLAGDITQLFIFGILAFFLGLWQNIRNAIVGLLFPFPGNPLPPGVQDEED